MLMTKMRGSQTILSAMEDNCQHMAPELRLINDRKDRLLTSDHSKLP